MKIRMRILTALFLCVMAFAQGGPSGGNGSGGSAVLPFTKAATTTTSNVKTTQGNFYGYYIYNPNASACSLDFFNVAAANVTLGTTVPVLSLVIPATAGANLYAPTSPMLSFSPALSVAAVTSAGGSSTCGTGMTVNLWYQ